MGKPCENSDAFIVDESGKIITKQGEIGELLVRGSCMSMGYYGDSERTKEVFVQNPAQNGQRYYLDVMQNYEKALKINPDNQLAQQLQQKFFEGMKQATGSN